VFQLETVGRATDNEELQLCFPDPSEVHPWSTRNILKHATPVVWKTGTIVKGLLDELPDLLEGWSEDETHRSWYSTKFNQETYDMVRLYRIQQGNMREGEYRFVLEGGSERTIPPANSDEEKITRASNLNRELELERIRKFSNRTPIYVTFLQLTKGKDHSGSVQAIHDAITEIERSEIFWVVDYEFLVVTPTGYRTSLINKNQFPSGCVKFASTHSTFMEALDA
jgi:hypothetical protein